MGNTIGSKRPAKVMKINGETMKFKTPIQAGKVLENYAGHVLLESEAVKHFGIRAKPMESKQELKPKRLYFLVELPEFPEEKNPRRVRSGIHLTAKDRLESLMLARRSVSDLSIMKPASIVLEEAKERQEQGAMRLKMRIPKSEVEKLMIESKDDNEVAAKIVDLYMENHAKQRRMEGSGGSGLKQHVTRKQEPEHEKEKGRVQTGVMKSREKRVGFQPFTEGEIQLAVAS